ncbi:MAG: polyprenol monophosphomannose synthase [Elusimicrobia bacterium]|nr:polyprenol monophosphomannose synthase [Elusimicrobiota bacterium]
MAERLLTVVIPTYNEAPNIAVLIGRLSAALQGVPHEILVADDDSPDRTWEIAQKLSASRENVRVLRRTSNRGLYPAVVEAFAAASGRCLAVLDADLQHDERILPAMLKALLEGRDLVVGSRHAEGGGIENWNAARKLLSLAGNVLVGWVLGRPVRDPLSGFFMIDRRAYEDIAPKLRPRGFKILMDILRCLPPEARISEVGYVFKPRQAGESKLGAKVAADFLLTLWEAAAHRLFGR